VETDWLKAGKDPGVKSLETLSHVVSEGSLTFIGFESIKNIGTSLFFFCFVLFFTAK
jgi:hypothetical protein